VFYPINFNLYVSIAELAEIEERTRKRKFEEKARMLKEIKDVQTKTEHYMEKHKQNKEKVQQLQDECEELRNRREECLESSTVAQPLLQKLQINWDDQTCAGTNF
jgi:predicted RNase H-like nuclease (RuvC/YqgF family)